MRNWLIFNGKSTKDFGVYISGLKTFDAPERDVEIISIPGRNGDLTIDNGRYKNIDVSYPAFIYDRMDENVAGLRNYMLSQNGYVRLEDTYHPDEFRLARFKGPFSAKVVDWLEAGEFDLTFDCYPQRFLKEGEIEITIPHGETVNVYNQYGMTSKPIIRVWAPCSFSINDVSIDVTTEDGSWKSVYIDCNTENAYSGNTNYNQYLTLSNGKFPELVSGNNTIVAGLSDVNITPRWWIL